MWLIKLGADTVTSMLYSAGAHTSVGALIQSWKEFHVADNWASFCPHARAFIGWRTNQRWDEAALGSWGESICYNPDICLNRSMINDVRPLMVWAMDQSKGKWSSTKNVGSGEFLAYIDASGTRQYLMQARAWYASHGPNAGLRIRLEVKKCQVILRDHSHGKSLIVCCLVDLFGYHALTRFNVGVS